MVNILSGILLVYLGVVIGEVKASIVAMREHEADKKNLDAMTETTAKMLLLIDKMLGEKTEDNDKIQE